MRDGKPSPQVCLARSLELDRLGAERWGVQEECIILYRHATIEQLIDGKLAVNLL